MRQSTAGGVRQPTLTSFSTPFSPPLISADVYFYYRDIATGLITGVQPVRFQPDGRVVIEDRIATGDLDHRPRRAQRPRADPLTGSIRASTASHLLMCMFALVGAGSRYVGIARTCRK